MLNFLRKLRRDNMNSKYLKYAIGEIVLVVIGILIALAINNWNEKRKAAIEEEQLLRKLKNENQINLETLKSDSLFFQELEPNLIELASTLKKEKSTSNDSIINNRLIRAIRVRSLDLSSAYLNRYLSASNDQQNDLITELLTLKEIYQGFNLADELTYEYKFEKILPLLEDSYDFMNFEITDDQKLRDQIFINRLLILSNIEYSKYDFYQSALEQSMILDSLIQERLKY